MQQRHNHPVDLDSLESEMHQLTSSVVSMPQPQRTVDHADHAVDHAEISALSADVVLEQYRLASKAIEAMGEEVQKRARALAHASEECAADMKLLKEAAEMVMEKGKLAHSEIERTTAVSRDIREVVAAIKAKLA